MKVKKSGTTYFIRLDKGDEIQESLLKVCKDYHITSGYIHGIGACQEVCISSYTPATKTFIEKRISGLLDMVSLEGNIAIDSHGQLRLHLHSLFSYRKQEQLLSIAGHLKEGIISYTGEIILVSFPEELHTTHDESLGIEVWDLE